MNSEDAAALINLMGFITGALLYAMLLAMILRAPRTLNEDKSPDVNLRLSKEKLLIATSILGLVWNLGALATFSIQGLTAREPNALLMSVALLALGFLPAVVVHSVLSSRQITADYKGAFRIIIIAYLLSAVAGGLHIYSAVALQKTPSRVALLLLTSSFSGLIIPLFFLTRKQQGLSRVWWIIALSIFAVSALHLSHHDGEHFSWFVELIGHHASLPLVLAILYQDYRFALADIFLKRALTFIALVALAFGLYIAIAAPLLSMHDGHISSNPIAVVSLLGMWVTTALLYSPLRRAVSWFVDKIILRRTDYDKLRAEIHCLVGLQESAEKILDGVCSKIEPALTAYGVTWSPYGVTGNSDKEGEGYSNVFPLIRLTNGETTQHLNTAALTVINERHHLENPGIVLPTSRGLSAVLTIPTTDPPRYALAIGQLSGGRRLLSDDIAMLESVAILVARRIDALRITHERCEQSLREQQISKLATEAELRALRAQINPHFLFNALTTIGYLIQAAPDRALNTLMQLTGLLRAVLRSAGEFVTVGEELALIESYLNIERERFEERLRVIIDVPQPLHAIRIPSLLIQPIVENAIKHGIAPSKLGGEVMIQVRLENSAAQNLLCITVRDTGAGASEVELAQGRKRGVGLNNVEQRLKSYYGQTASLSIHTARNFGSSVEIHLPANLSVETHTAETTAERKRA